MHQYRPYYAIVEDQETGYHGKADGAYCHQYGGERGEIQPVESVSSPEHDRGEHYQDWGENLFAWNLIEAIAQGYEDGAADDYTL